MVLIRRKLERIGRRPVAAALALAWAWAIAFAGSFSPPLVILGVLGVSYALIKWLCPTLRWPALVVGAGLVVWVLVALLITIVGLLRMPPPPPYELPVVLPTHVIWRFAVILIGLWPIMYYILRDIFGYRIATKNANRAALIIASVLIVLWICTIGWGYGVL